MLASHIKNIAKLKLFFFLSAIILLSDLSLAKKMKSSSKTSLGAVTFELTGNRWKKLTDESSTAYTLPEQSKDYLIAYGYSNKWVIKKVQNSFTCSNSYFGEDPYSKIKKACYALDGFTAFKSCANEGETCLMIDGDYKLVRYGDKGTDQYTYQLTTLKFISCSNSVFGDPAEGITKICSYVLTNLS